MTGRRAMIALAAFAAALALQAGCVAVFGVDDKSLLNAVTEMCKCDSLQGVDSCETTLTDRLNGASSAAQTAWLAHYVNDCLDDCLKAPICLAESPTCSLDRCKMDSECCTLGDAGKAKCDGFHCKQP